MNANDSQGRSWRPVCALLISLSVSGPAQEQTLIPFGATWRWTRGTNEASNPTSAWRQPAFNDAAWLSGTMPFHYGYTNVAGGTPLPDMRNNYTTIYLRRTFVVTDPASLASLRLRQVIDDGFIVWINGVEVQRYNVNPGEQPYNATTPVSIGVTPVEVEATVPDPAAFLVAGTNLIAVHGINRSLTSSDFHLDLELKATPVHQAPPGIASVAPPAGSTVSALSQVVVSFTKPVVGVNADDLLVNGQPARAVSGGSGTNTYTFSFAEPPPGPVQLLFDVNHAITDLQGRRFDESAPTASWQYTLADTQSPGVARVRPVPGATVGALTRIEVTFNEPVTGVDAADLRLNGQPARQVVGALAGPYTFEFDPPAPGTVNITWAAGHGIQDTAPAANLFAGAGWSYLLDAQAAFGDVVINEFLADNLTGLVDEDGQKQDWIELWNRGTNSVHLLGWALTDDPQTPDAWTFPAVTLHPGQYLIVFASGKDRKPTAPGSRLHTHFRLGAEGEYLALYNAELPPQGLSEYAPAFPEQRGDVSYGLTASNTAAYFTSPTPGAANSPGSIVAGIVQPVHASVNSGFFDQPFSVVLSSATPGTEIRYTLDGSVPTPASPLYTGPLPVVGQPHKAVVLLRAAAFKPGWLASPVVARTYIFPEHVLTQPANPAGFPAVWDSPGTKKDTSADYEMDPQVITNAAAGYPALARQGLTSIPTVSIMTHPDLLFGPAAGVYVRREDFNHQPVNVELILPDGRAGFNVTCGLEVQGGTSVQDWGNDWKSKKLSLRLLFKGDFGTPKLRYPVFPDSPVTSFDTLVLDAGLNLCWHYMPNDDQRRVAIQVRDQFVSDLQSLLSGTAPHGRFVHLYLNGLYWGVYDLHERPDDAFSAAYFGGEKSDYDVLKHNANNVVAGDNLAYQQLFAVARSGLTNPAIYEALQQHLDLPWFIDYMLLNFWVGNTDWAHQNWYACRRRAPEGRWRYLSWDAEHVLKSATENRLSVTNSGGPTELFQLLRANPEFRLRFADHVHRHCFHGGVLSADPARPIGSRSDPGGNAPAAVLLRRIAEIDPAVVCESARWGDVGTNGVNRADNPLTRNVEWLNELDALLGLRNTSGHTWNFFPTRTANVLNQFRSAGLYPPVTAPAFNRHGGAVPAGFLLTLSAAGGTIYYTTNGTDPRVYGSGAVSPQAVAYAGAIPLNDSLVVKARTLSNGVWSALCEASFRVGQLGLPLAITEIMYNPAPGGSGGTPYEFLEIQNVGALPLDLSGFSFQGITFVLPTGTVLPPCAVLVLANNANPTQFAARYPGVIVSGWYGGNLDNGGERIAILDRDGRTVVAVHYDDEGGWPTEPDGFGPSLEVIDPRGDPNAPANWRASSAVNGTPGNPPAPPTPGNVVLNEVLADNASAVENGGAFPDWVELHNRGGSPVNLGNWSLSDSSVARKFVFPTNTLIPAGGFLVVWCDTATNAPGLHTGFALGKNGETVSLFNAATNRVDALTFGLQLADYSVGRIGEEWRLTLPTPGAPNVAAALASPTNLTLNEWLANAPPGGADWIELFNRASNAPVALRGLGFATSNALFRYNALSFVPPRGYVQLLADELPGANHLEFKLPAAGGAIVLYDEAATEMERVSYGPQSEGISEGRLPDGSANIVAFPGSASPAASNYLLAWSGPVLNEMLARNQRAVVGPWGNYADFVELFNPNSTNVPLGGMALGKSLAPGDRWTIPAGVSLPAGGYLVIWCDGARAASTSSSGPLNAGFNLPGESGGVYLFNPAGQPVNWVEYGFQVEDLSIGLAAGQWQLLASPTPGAANSAAATRGPATALRINEWMAAPRTGDDWFELYNPGALPVALGGLLLTDDPSTAGLVKSPIPPLSFIGGRSWVRFIADGSRSAGADHVNFKLDRDGETIRLYDANTNLIDAVDFGWQADGVSQGRLPDGAAPHVSFPETPTPGAANYLPLASVVIHEVLSHTDPPLEDAIELFNPTTNAVAIGGWYLSDSAGDLQRYRIPDGTVIPAGGFRVFYQYQFGPTNSDDDAPPLFTLNSAHGDAVYLSQADAGGNLTGYRADVSFGAAANGVSFGRYQTSVGVDFVALSQRTFGVDNPTNLAHFRTGTGASNADPLVGPVVINEIMYHPPPGNNAAENPNEEFIELHNLAVTNVPLYDPAHPTNRWRLANAVSFEFPPATSLPAGGYLLVVPFDPATNPAALAAFRARYGTNATPLVGPYAGKLDNAGETVELWRPDTPQAPPRPDAGFVPYVLVDRVAYADAAPWPIAAGGGGASLQRIAPGAYGNEPLNWKAEAPTAGRTNRADAGLAPFILTPPADQTAIAGQRVEFTVLADGTPPLAYLWHFQNAPLAGRTDAQLVLDPVLPSDAGEYRVRVTNAFGSLLSAPALLTVWVPPQILSPPQNQTLNLGQPAQFTVVATGTAPLRYQWQRHGSDLSGQTAATLAFAQVTLADAGPYRVLVSNVAGVVTSTVATLTVRVPPIITAHPQSGFAPLGGNLTLTVSATGDAPLTYQWYFHGTNLPGATSAVLTLNHLRETDSGPYQARVTNLAGAAWSAPAVLTVLAPPTLQQPGFTEDAEFSAWLVGPTHRTYAIEVSTNLLDWAEAGRIVHTNAATVFVDPATPPGPRYYRARVVE